MTPLRNSRISHAPLFAKINLAKNHFILGYKPIGAAPWGHFLWRGEGAFGQKRL